MRKHRMPDMKEGGVNVTPLIDIVMCLIIFFMLVAKIGVSGGEDRAIQIPITEYGKELETHSNTLTLNVRPGADQPMVTTMVVGSSRGPDEIRIVDPASGRHPLTELLKGLRYGADKKLGTPDDNAKFSVIIRAEADMEYRYLEPVLLACAEANVQNVNFNTKKKTEQVVEAPTP